LYYIAGLLRMPELGLFGRILGGVCGLARAGDDMGELRWVRTLLRVDAGGSGWEQGVERWKCDVALMGEKVYQKLRNPGLTQGIIELYQCMFLYLTLPFYNTLAPTQIMI
jgi:hypothetical protein